MHMFESLESRRLMSVVANFADGSKAVQTGASLVVSASTNSLNDLAVVENLNGTMGQNVVTVINNRTGQQADFFGIFNQVQINGSAGNDTLVFSGETLSANMQGSSGADRLTLRDTSANGG